MLFNPLVPFFQLLSREVVFPIPDLTLPEELVHHVLGHGHADGPVLPHVANVQVVVQGQNLKSK